jgi:hypothetical protein
MAKPKIDLIMAVDDLKAFHDANMKVNPHHYTWFARGTHGHVVNFIQSKGAKIHFNYIYEEDLTDLVRQNKVEAEMTAEELKKAVSGRVTPCVESEVWHHRHAGLNQGPPVLGDSPSQQHAPEASQENHRPLGRTRPQSVVGHSLVEKPHQCIGLRSSDHCFWQE